MSSAVISEKTEQLISLQRQLDQQQATQVAAQEAMKREREITNQLEAQVATLNEKLAAAQATELQLQRQVSSTELESVEQKASAREVKVSARAVSLWTVLVTSSLQTELTALVDSLRGELEHAHCRLKETEEELISIKEQLAGTKPKRKKQEQDIAKLKKVSFPLIVAELLVTPCYTPGGGHSTARAQ